MVSTGLFFTFYICTLVSISVVLWWVFAARGGGLAVWGGRGSLGAVVGVLLKDPTNAAGGVLILRSGNGWPGRVGQV
jgi:hypothetical protein